MTLLAASFWLHDLWHPLSGNGYQFWSGAGSDFGELAIITGLVALLRRHNCHVRGCWRIGRHPVDGTPYHVCRQHHPTVPDDGPSVDDVHAAHRQSRVGAVKVKEGE